MIRPIIQRMGAATVVGLMLLGFGGTTEASAVVLGKAIKAKSSSTSTGVLMKVRATAAPATIPFFGGAINMTYQVTNTTRNPLTIKSMVDGHGLTVGGTGCEAGTKLARGASCQFSRILTISGNVSSVTESITVKGKASGATETLTASTPIILVQPSNNVAVTPIASASSVPAAGGTVKVTVTIKNPLATTQTIQALHDSWFGSTSGGAHCTIGTVLGPGASCSYEESIFASSNAGSTMKVLFDAALTDSTGVLNVGQGKVSWSFV